MAQSFNRVVASGNTSVFSVPFPYLDRGHVVVSRDGTPTTSFVWTSSGAIELLSRPTAGTIVKVQRQTPTAPLVTFQQGNLDPDDLNITIRQAVYVAQEAYDRAGDYVLRDARETALDARGFRLINLAAGTQPTDAVNRQQLIDALATVGVGDELLAQLREQVALAGELAAILTEATSGDIDFLATYMAARA